MIFFPRNWTLDDCFEWMAERGIGAPSEVLRGLFLWPDAEYGNGNWYLPI